MARKITEAQYRANAKYDAAHTVQFKMKLNTGTDADILAWLDSLPNKQGYVKELIRADIARVNSQIAEDEIAKLKEDGVI